MGYFVELLNARVLNMLLMCLVAASVTACGGESGGGEQTSDRSTLTVLAASSLTDAFGELENAFEQQNQDVDVTTCFAGSLELLTQIQQGAPADVFASADEAKLNTALQDELVKEPKFYARNRPVVMVPADNSAGIKKFGDLADANAQIVLAEESVPIASYAEEVLDNADAEYGGAFAQRFRDKIVSREANVRASANRVAL